MHVLLPHVTIALCFIVLFEALTIVSRNRIKIVYLFGLKNVVIPGNLVLHTGTITTKIYYKYQVLLAGKDLRGL